MAQGEGILVKHQRPEIGCDVQREEKGGDFLLIPKSLDQVTATIVKKDLSGQQQQVVGIPPPVEQKGKGRQPKLGRFHPPMAQQVISQKGQGSEEEEEG